MFVISCSLLNLKHPMFIQLECGKLTSHFLRGMRRLWASFGRAQVNWGGNMLTFEGFSGRDHVVDEPNPPLV